MNRRQLLQSLAAATAGSLSLPVRGAPPNLRIDKVDVIVTNPARGAMGNYVLVKITTNQPGLYGWGDATCTGSELGVAKFLEEHLTPGLLGKNPLRIEELWQRVFFLPYYRSGSVHMSAVSGIDMALWDIKGKVADLPVYELLGGKVRDRMLTYGTTSGKTIEEATDNVAKLVERGYRVIKVSVSSPGNEGGYAVPASGSQRASLEKAYAEGVAPEEVWEPESYVRILPKLFDHLSKKFPEHIQWIHDVHERITPAQALKLSKTLEPYNFFYFEDPLRPEHLDTFRLMRKLSTIPISMGEIYTGQWDGLGLVEEHLIDYVRHDLAHCGAITTGKKVAAICEPKGILTAWHGPSNISPITHQANCAVSLSVPNFGIQEYVTGGWNPAVHEVFTGAPVYADGHITANDQAGLGIEVNEAAARKNPYVRRLRPAIRRADGTPWPY